MSKRILIVDDEPLLRLDLKGILEDNGYQIIGEGSDGFEAVELCRKHKPDLVIMDINMPILDGIKAGKIITKENLAGGVLMLGSAEDRNYIEEAKSIGAFGYLIKGTNNNFLIPNIEMCLNKVSEFEKMKNDLEKLTKKFEERKLIDKAKGILIKELNITEEEAYSKIRKLSMDKRTTMMEIGNMIIMGHAN